MHDYSMRGHPRERLIYFIAAGAFSLMPLITDLSGWLGVGLAVTSFTLFSLLFVAFDRYLWKVEPFRRLLGVPNLNGEWTCSGCQYDDDGNETRPWQGNVCIRQTWSRIAIALRTVTSTSCSGPASIEPDEGLGYRVLFSYTNEPQPGNPNLKPHRGTCDLMFSADGATARGSYFTDYHRQSFGCITLTKVAAAGKEEDCD